MQLVEFAGVLRHLAGWRPDAPDHRDRRLSLRAPATLPPSADLRAYCSTIEDQGAIGSCTANCSTSAIEALYRKSGFVDPAFSRLYLYFVTRVRIEGAMATDDSGCSLRDTMKALASIGVCGEGLWPYDIERYAETPPIAADVEAGKRRVIQYLACPTLDAVRQSLADGFPVTGGFAVPESMMSEAVTVTGAVELPAASERIIGGHAVLFVGYHDPSRRLVFQNSWGLDWGDKGFGSLPYGFFDASGNGPLADDCWTIRSEMMPSPMPSPPAAPASSEPIDPDLRLAQDLLLTIATDVRPEAQVLAGAVTGFLSARGR